VDSAATVFLVIGGVGVAVLALSLLVGDLLHLGHPDADGPFSLPAVAGFVGAFGFIGAVGASLPLPGSPAVAGSALGLVAAVPTAWFAVRLARAAAQMRSDATPTRSDLVGTVGVVVSPIPDSGYGQVRVRLGGQPVQLNARSDRPLPSGARILVVLAPSDTSVVVEETP